MRHALLVGTLASAMWLTLSIATACPHGAKWGCPLLAKHAEYSLSDKGEKIEVSVTVHGCQGMKASLLERLQSEFGKATTEKCADNTKCPFCVKGLSFSLKETDQGGVLTVEGQRAALDQFKARFQSKMEMRKKGESEEGCGCKHHKD